MREQIEKNAIHVEVPTLHIELTFNSFVIVTLFKGTKI